jgi:cell surface protein SprA
LLKIKQKSNSNFLFRSLNLIFGGLVIFSIILAASNNKAFSDSTFYASNYCRYFEQYNLKKGDSKYSDFLIIPPFINYSIYNESFFDFKENIPFNIFAPDTTKKDSLKILPLGIDSVAPLPLDILDAVLNDTIDVVTKGDDKNVDSLFNLNQEPETDPFLEAILDSLRQIDTTQIRDSVATAGAQKNIFYDSTARVEHLRYLPKDNITAPYFEFQLHPLFRTKKTSVIYEAKIDTNTNMVKITETINGKNIRIPVYLTIDEYIEATRDYYSKKNWGSIAHKYEFKYDTAKKEVGALLSNITNIDIPIPDNPIMSIFGDRSRINLRIAGNVEIIGAFRSSTSDLMQTNLRNNTRNEPDFKQNVSIMVDGTIGDKLNIGANWDTQRMFDYENQLKIAYTGYEDELIQKIEAGNVALSTAAGLVGSSQALFGIKAEMKIGPVKLTTVASQKKSEKKSKSVDGGAQETAFELRAYEYAQNHFFVDTLYRKTFYPFYGYTISTTTPSLGILDMEVWVTRPGSLEDPQEREVIADINLPALPQSGRYDASYDSREQMPDETGSLEIGKFIRLEREKYKYNKWTGVITLTTSVSQNQAIAVAYKTQDGNTYGTFSDVIDTTQKRVVLKLVKPSNLIPQFKQAWSMQLKNIYSIGGRGLNEKSLKDVKIYYTKSGQEDQDNIDGISLLTILGLDRVDDAGTGGPDGKFDFSDQTIDKDRGEIIFPWLEPFREGFLNYKELQNASDYTFGDVYDTTIFYAQQNTERNKFVIRGKFTSSSTSTYRLGMSVVPNSVRVTLNGSPLIAGQDYMLDEMSGTVVIRKEEALVPGASLQIEYEENDLMSFASKTLFGASAEIDIGKTTKLGVGWMNLSQQTLSDKIRLGEEPTNNHIFGASLNSNHELPSVTKALNYLPFYRSKEMSTFGIRGDVAYILPDANTKKSLIESDQGEGIAYIDDFEGSKISIPVLAGWSIWRSCSAPVELEYHGRIPEETMMGYKAKTTWGSMENMFFKTDIWPQRRSASGENMTGAMIVEYYPDRRAEYNYTPTIGNPKLNWGGMMRALGSSATNLAANNYTALEIWMQIEGDDLQDAKLYIDLGKISERVIVDPRIPSNGGLHTEDGITADAPTINGTLNPGEDVGLDGLTDEQERALFPELGDDPSGDNFHYVQGTLDFSGINGTEGNSVTEAGLFPDTEDINRNGVLDLINSYFEYEIPLDTVKAIRDKKIVGGGNKGWYQFRIMLSDYKTTIGSPSLDVVETIRMHIAGTNKKVTLRMVQLDIVGNQWQTMVFRDSTGAVVEDTVLKISTVSVEETPYYTMPPGLSQEKDRTNTKDQNLLKNEQSLALIINGLEDGQMREAVKYFTSRPLDVFNYNTMKMFIHGDKSFNYIDSSNYDVEFSFKFGVDTSNYYEYVLPIQDGWEKNDIVVEFAKLTSAKQFQDTTGGKLGLGVILIDGKPGHRYQVMGRPTLTNITYFSLGVRNPFDKGTTFPIYGEIWADELRLSNVNNTPGMAYRVEASLKIGTLGNVSFNYSKTDPNFHSVDRKFGSRSDDQNWGVSTNFALQNLLPQSLSSSTLNITYSHTETVSKPLYMPGTDVKVEETAQELERIDPLLADSLRLVTQTVRVNETISMPTLSIKVKSNEWYIRETINKLNFGFNYNTQSERSPTLRDRQYWTWDFRSDYSADLNQISNFLSVSPFSYFEGVFLLDQFKDYKISIFPKSVGFGMSANRSRTEEQYRLESTMRKPIRNFTSARNMKMDFKFTEGGLLNIGTTYGLNVAGSLAHLESDSSGFIQNSNKDIFSKIFLNQGLIYFGEDNSYNQDIAISTKPTIPDIFNLPVFIELTGDYRVGYKWQHNFTLGDLGKSAGFASNISGGMNFKLKALGEAIFGSSSDSRSYTKEPVQNSQTQSEKPDTTSRRGGIDILAIVKSLFQIPLFDYDNISLNFTQGNSSSNSGIPGSTGFGNLWARVPFFQDADIENGPSSLYQLGLISDPTGSLTNFGFRPKFPFFGWDHVPGVRVPNQGTTFADNFAQQNSITLGTSRTLFQNISIQINWKVGWNYNKNRTLQADENGNIDFERSTEAITADLDRSFLIVPDILSGIFGNSIDKVSARYAEYRANEADTARSRTEKFVAAFEEGFEFLPILRSIVGEIAPRANWSIRWTGIEKIPFLVGIANSISISHTYQSNFTKRYRVVEGNTITESQRISYSFNPLLGIEVSFKDVLGGKLAGNIRYSNGGNYDLNTSSENIVQVMTNDIAVSTSYSKSGLNIPLFGLYLKNDIEISLTVGYGKGDEISYNVVDGKLKGEPRRNDKRLSFEPRFGYTMSSKIRGSVYYKYNKTENMQNTGSTTNEGGLNVNITIN